MDFDNTYNYYEYDKLHCCWNCYYSEYQNPEGIFLHCALTENFISPVGICDKFKKPYNTMAVGA